jgi:cyclic beta-1,2-glucan synthetase
MAQETHPGIVDQEAGRPRPAVVVDISLDMHALRSKAAELASNLAWLPNTPSSRFFIERWRELSRKLGPMLATLQAPLGDKQVSDELRWLHDNLSLLYAELQATGEGLKPLHKIPHVRLPNGAVVPRVAALAEGILIATEYQFSQETFASYVSSFQEVAVLKIRELWALVPAVKLLLLEQIAHRASRLLAGGEEVHGVGICIRSLRDAGQTSWKEVIEPLILLDLVLRDDPAGVYSRMDFENRDQYRNKLVRIAEHSDFTEGEVALEALALARDAKQQGHAEPRVAARRSHIGYYLVAEGARLLQRRVGARPSFVLRMRSFLREHPDESYLGGIGVLTFAIISVILLLLTDPYSPLAFILFSMLVLLLPCSQTAVQLMNYVITALLPAEILPKIDLSAGVPDDCVTMVAVPCLLLNQDQVHRLVDDLEVRFLGNHDPNVHFALVSDLPDSPELSREDDPLVDLCAQLIRNLNEQYSGQNMGSFFLFHRHRIYNPRERVWMGWERKRGKLLELNKLLRQQSDSFPVKVGDLSILPQTRFVITLDADTELPRGSAHRMVGALAHPLNQAIIDGERNIVVTGYGILQPRVGVSVQSAARSRLASIYSGQTGFDIYTRAVSDVYQDLYGEGSFAGKGIYEVDTVHRVLDRRFPRNALLSHDLIEGAYARAGLLSDVEIIEDYPSHYSAYNRRKHRWLRGDWQIVEWLTPRVPDESGSKVRNPISMVAQWKILDNLRRSLVEPATFLLLVFGWLVLPGDPRYWTLVTVILLFVPALFRFIFDLVRAAVEEKAGIARDALSELFASFVNVFLTLTFLAHQMLLSLDAVARALVRHLVTRRRLLEWVTAAEAEIGSSQRAALEIYLDWTPALALGLGLLLFFARRSALLAALPILVLWAGSKFVSLWLNEPPLAVRDEASEKDQSFLRQSALRSWRYYSEFSTQEHNWLVPDNVQEQPAVIAARISPTNLGFLLNARQAACELGYLTISEFAEQTRRTLDTVATLQRCRGHLFNWYDTRTLAPLPPLFISSVDSGNLVASLWTLQQGCLDRLRQPILQPSLADGLIDHLQILAGVGTLSQKRFSAIQSKIKGANWLAGLLDVADKLLEDVRSADAGSDPSADAGWFIDQSRVRIEKLKLTVRLYAPWLLPEFSSLRGDPALALGYDSDSVMLEETPGFIDRLSARLQVAIHRAESADRKIQCQRLQEMLVNAHSHALGLVRDLRRIAADADKLANEMDFRFLLNPRRNLLSVGFDVESQQLQPACYDLLASEARVALFVAIAKDDIPQESWFRLGRAHTIDHGRPILVSWTGTMFEYLMPALWMRTFRDTLLERSRSAAVRAQRTYTAARNIPWGISESAYSKMDEAGNYQYYAFGLPHLALRNCGMERLVISPYSTFLALHVDASEALKNLRKMHRDGWFGAYGFYEAADYGSSPGRSRRNHRELVRCWMAHHQGMTLLSIANFLQGDVVQRWFHADPRVQATELLLHEKPVSYVRPPREGYGTAAA